MHRCSHRYWSTSRCGPKWPELLSRPASPLRYATPALPHQGKLSISYWPDLMYQESAGQSYYFQLLLSLLDSLNMIHGDSPLKRSSRRAFGWRSCEAAHEVLPNTSKFEAFLPFF
jgi:hypothetical protein